MSGPISPDPPGSISAGDGWVRMSPAAADSPSDPCRLSAADAAEAIQAGRLTSEELVRSCLAAVAACEPQVGAWAFLDPDQALARARGADRARAEGRRVGPL
ncbi:MAG: hypothetical protein ACREMB_11425, partial [Candidatus Rokuibacteriota bacterium]